MKKVLAIIIITSVFAACRSDSKNDLETNKVVLADSGRISSGSASSDTGTAAQTGARPGRAVTEKTKTSTSTKANSGTATTTSTTTTTAPAKKGWSNRAKGAV